MTTIALDFGQRLLLMLTAIIAAGITVAVAVEKVFDWIDWLDDRATASLAGDLDLTALIDATDTWAETPSEAAARICRDAAGGGA